MLARWGGVEVRRVEHGAVAAWAADVAATSSASTTRKAVGVLRSVLELAVKDRRIAANPALAVSLPRLPTLEQRFLDASELEALAGAMAERRDELLTLVLGWTGIRFGEAAALKVESVDPLRRRLRIAEAVAEVRGRVIVDTPKTHAARTVTLPTFLAEWLAEHLEGKRRSAIVFADRDGGPLRATNWNRRTFVKVVQLQLGHRTATLTLDVYGHLYRDELDALSDALDGLKARAPADSWRIPSTVSKIGDGRR